MQQTDVSTSVSAAGKAAGVGKVTPHDFRRSVASLANRRGVDVVQGARMVGMTPSVYLEHYVDDYGRAQREEARRRLLDSGFGAADEEAVTDYDEEGR